MSQFPWIENLGLKPLEMEGGWYREMYRSSMMSAQGRSLGTAIYYFLQNGDKSLFHRLDVDEVYFFLDGDPVEVFILSEDGLRVQVLGPDPARGHLRMLNIFRNTWHASKLVHGGVQALLSTVTFPAFQFEGFELGVCADLIINYPAQRDLIQQMTKS